jgi:thiol-disulfide isomerase/thioredoxin
MKRHVAASCMFTVVACSSPKDVAVAGDTGAIVEDTAPLEDTAPWLTYPEGPYGLKVGETFPNFAFKGYKDGTGEWTDISMIDYYDPDGTRGINGIYWVVSAQWCPPCREEAKILPGMLDRLYRPRGARFATAMIQDSKRNPATQLTVDQWLAAYRLNFDIVLDDEPQTLPSSGTVGLPYNYIINPRDMKVYRIIQGVNPEATTIPPLSSLLTKNGAPPPPAMDAGTTPPADTGTTPPADTGTPPPADTGTPPTSDAAAD